MPGTRPIVRLLTLLLLLLPAVQYGVACVPDAAGVVAGTGHQAAGAHAAHDDADATSGQDCCPQHDAAAECDDPVPSGPSAVEHECCMLDAAAAVPSAIGGKPDSAGSAASGSAGDGGDLSAASAPGFAPPAATRSPAATPSGPPVYARARVPLWLSTARLRL